MSVPAARIVCMPGVRHEAVVELVHRFPQLLSALLRKAQVQAPAGLPREVDSNLSARRPLGFMAENVFVFRGDADNDKLVVVFEVQSDPPRPGKRRDWAAYLAIAAREYECDAVVLVFALSRETARASRAPILIGPGNAAHVVVVGPDELPRDVPGLGVQLAMLAAVSGAVDLDRRPDQLSTLDRIADAPPEDRAGYTRLVLAVASDQARAELEVLMFTTYKDTLVDRLLAEGEARGLAEGEAKGLAEGRARGEATGEAKLLLRALEARGLDVPADVRNLVTSCRDTTRLESWFDRAITATSIEDVFGKQ